jgi:hypothetical protein
MRGFPTARSHVVPLLEAFNFLGYLVEPIAWDESESSAVRIGQRGKVDRRVRHRGFEALKIMRNLSEAGLINLIYTDEQRRRVPYYQSSGYWLSAIFPDPAGTGEGMIELDDRYIHPCVADIRQIAAWRSARTIRTGPKRGFAQFDTALDEYFTNNPTAKANAEVIFELGQTYADMRWPGKTVMHERINDARNRASARIKVGTDSGRTPDGE